VVQFKNVIGYAGEDYVARNAVDGTVTDHAFTLAKLRKEERLLNADYPVLDKLRLSGMNLDRGDNNYDDGFEPSDNNETHFDQVDEMYDNLNKFDQRLKQTLKAKQAYY
jgi:hypothetical protein